jgi:hypothetical protein
MIFLLIALAGICIFFIAFGKAYLKKTDLIQKEPACNSRRIGEKITYIVKLGKLNLGRAVFRQMPNTLFKGKTAYLMTFETKVAGFIDLETIYSDPETLLPVMVQRRISTWPSTEKITEDYDQQKFILVIKKFKNNKKEEMVIKRNGVINNAILLPFYVRDVANLEVGYNLIAGLPNQKFMIELVAIEEVNVPAGKFMAYRFESRPKKFEIWISADERRIPVKINGTTGLGYTLAMQKHSLD